MTDRPPIEKLRWLEQVADDPDIRGAAFQIAFDLARRINAKSKECWPSHATLAARAGISDRYVRTAIALLINNGHLARKSGGGRRRSNTYSLVLKSPNSGSGIFDENPEAKFRVSAETRNYSSKNPEPQFRQTPFTNTVREEGGNMRLRERAAGAALAEAFDAFMDAYPKNQDGNRQLAAKAFIEAVEAGVAPAVMIEGAKRYKASGQNPIYPYVWIKQQGWREDWKPAPKRSGGPSARRRGGEDPVEAVWQMLGGTDE